MKGGYDHYMQKEIHEQPESVLQTMRGRVKMLDATPKVSCPAREWTRLWGPICPRGAVQNGISRFCKRVALA